ncbi:MAG: hypothetical protein JJT89_16930 [Nitriliruptoraceae bacterium]|nr:hypothetical protein [Nitriliruptoraceae bacterium]
MTRADATSPTAGRPTRRLVQLWAGLMLYGASLGLLVEAGLGLAPWDVLHQGLSLVTRLSIGTWVIITGAAVLVLWIPLRQRPGIGTVSNVILIGVALDVTLAVLPSVTSMPLRITCLLLGIGLNAIATACYLGARLGPGPRDGLMTGLAARGWSIRLARSTVEVTVLAIGWVLGGTVGIGTLVYALGIGPLVQPLLPRLSVPIDGVAAGHDNVSLGLGRWPGPRGR